MKKIAKFLLLMMIAWSAAMPARAASTLWEHYNSIGLYLPSVQERSIIYEMATGKSDYVGSFDQNTKLLSYLEKEENFGAAGGSHTLPQSMANFNSSLVGKISESATSFTLVDSVDSDGNTLSGWYGLTLDPGTTKQEYVIANCAGASCSSVYRGVSLVDGQSTSTSRTEIHGRGAKVSITDHPNITIITNILNGNQATPGGLTFGDHSLSFGSGASSTITFVSGGVLTNINSISGLDTPSAFDLDHVANVEYVNNSEAAGAANATTLTKGISQSATTTSPSTIGKKYGSTGAIMFLPAEMASSTYSSRYMIPVTNSSGKLSQSFLDLTEEFRLSSSTINNSYLGTTIFSLLPGAPTSTTATEGKVLVMGEGNKLPSWDGSNLTTLTPYIYIASLSDNLKVSLDTQRQTTVDGTILKSMGSNIHGYVRIKYDIVDDNVGGNTNGRIYKNGVAVGTERTSSDSWTTYTEDYSYINTGDIFDFRKTGGLGGVNLMIRNFRIYYDIEATSSPIAIITN